MRQWRVRQAGIVILKAALFLGLLLYILLKIQQTLKLDMGHRGTDNINGFYEEKDNSVQVLFVGASTMFCTTDPLVLYEDYGIGSYNFGSSAQPFELSYLFMQEALKTQKPKVIGLEVINIFGELDTSKADNLNYGVTDLPFSREKAAGLYDMFRNDKGAGLAYLIPMAQYKDRWQELTKEDFIDDPVNYTKGAYTPDLVSDAPLDFSSYYKEKEEEFAIPERNREIFRRMVDLCEENDIELLLFKSPSVGWNIGQTKSVQELADEYGLPFIDYYSLMGELGIDPAHDFRDNTHLNRYGSKKTSDHMGQYLKEHYELFDYRITDSLNSWDVALAQREHDRANEKVSRTVSLPDYMAALPYEGHTVAFCVTGELDDTMAEFVTNLAQAFGLDAQKTLEGGSFLVEDGQCVSGLIGMEDGTWRWEHGFDVVKLTGYSITYNREVYQLVDDGLTIFVYDNDWERFVDVAGFDVYDPAHCVRSEAA